MVSFTTDKYTTVREYGAIISVLFLVGSSSIIFAQEHSSPETIDHEEKEYNLEFAVGIAHWLTGIASVVLAIALIRTFHHMRIVTEMTSIET